MSEEQIAASLNEADCRALTSDWDAFCQCDWGDMSCESEGFAERLEAKGFVEFGEATPDDLDQSFADDLGIVPGGSVWRLTPLGLRVRQHLLSEPRP